MKEASSNPAGKVIETRVLVRGAGDFATGIIHRLHSAGFRVAATELGKPLAVRRGAALSEAVYEGAYTVEGVTAELTVADELDRVLENGRVPVIIDPEGSILERGFDIVVDARSAKRNLGTRIDDAPIVVAIGPGFEAGVDCHAVVETLPGEGTGRVIYEGPASQDTAHPDPLEKNSPCTYNLDDVRDLVPRAPNPGTFNIARDIGSEVERGDTIGWVSNPNNIKQAVKSNAKGIIRGIIRDGTPVKMGMKLGDIDPTMNKKLCYSISGKSRAIAGGVLEACMTLLAGRGAAGNRASGSS